MAVTLLDGGMGQELVRRMGKPTPLWSMQALIDAPELVRAVHNDFFAAGAEVATTNSYAVLPDRLAAFDLSDKLAHLIETSCRLATDARDAAGGGCVAGSLGPLGFSYQPDNAPAPEIAAEIYADVARLHAPLVDVLLLETMSSVAQARGGLMGAGVPGKPIWLALSVDDTDGTRLRSGEPLDDIAPLLAEFAPDRVLLNCSRPEAISQGLPVLAGMHPHVGAYANGFTRIAEDFSSIGATTDLLSARQDLGPEEYATFAEAWVDAGAQTVGGCCEVGPDHIAVLARRFHGAKAAAPLPVTHAASAN
ncbi:homocysteine S-methyltransferase family protein [Cognatishimia sp. F0-27]|uniref:homocysteine S-methyltransferase family protein n=1 Tax=Cognatishimia sp. F0-27 TaxID=2816855 RepID=UPI001D0C6D20|nr:homocysteine S-methyltransferase family protein [Cognatishimia sp. F0-27]MCC1492616.1 homocysteine S-methyltransferase family protein [Cognatishimia sp. F0-27]